MLSIATALSIASLACDNEVELLSEDASLPVVYGLIDGSSDLQRLSISRTFRFSDGGNAIASAREPDSVYYATEDLTVVARNLSSELSTTLKRVNLSDDDAIVREDGSFPTEVNVAYEWRLSDVEGEPGDSIAIVGTLPGGGTFAVGGALLPALTFRTNPPFPQRYTLNSEQNRTSFNWRRSDIGPMVAVWELGLNFAFQETGPDGTVDRVLYYPLVREATLRADQNSLRVDNERFGGLYGFLASRLEPDPAITRSFQYVQAVVTGGDSSYVEFKTLIRANSGITATQELPAFSNVEGGLGLVGTVTRLAQPPTAGLQPSSLDSLRSGSQTQDLNF